MKLELKDPLQPFPTQGSRDWLYIFFLACSSMAQFKFPDFSDIISLRIAM